MSDLHFPDCQGKAWETRTHLEKAGEKLWTFLLWSNWKLPHSWEAEAGPDGTDSAQAHLPTWDQSHIYVVSENCAWACFTWPGKSIDVFEAKLSFPLWSLAFILENCTCHIYIYSYQWKLIRWQFPQHRHLLCVQKSGSAFVHELSGWFYANWQEIWLLPRLSTGISIMV